jgi:hypothetical protein
MPLERPRSWTFTKEENWEYRGAKDEEAAEEARPLETLDKEALGPPQLEKTRELNKRKGI